tara:strand:- start:220 stop:450 length:231 start_codon:yes stop_codon:yes gene_type:complete
MRQEDKPKKKIKKKKTLLAGSFKDDIFEDKKIIQIGNSDLGRYLFMHEKAIKEGNGSKFIRANYRAILKELRRRDQ